MIAYVCVSALIWNCNCITVRHNITIRICVNMCITALFASASFFFFLFFVSLFFLCFFFCLHARRYALVSVRVYARSDPDLYLHT